MIMPCRCTAVYTVLHHLSTLDKEILLNRVLETFSQLSKLQGQGH